MSDESDAAERVLMESEIEARATDLRRQLEGLRRSVEAAEARYGEEAVREKRELLERLERRIEGLGAES